MNFNEIETKSYRQYFGGGRFYDNVDEYTYTTDKSLNIGEINKVLEDAGKYLWGEITYIKKQLSKAGRVIGYKHIVKVAMSPN